MYLINYEVKRTEIGTCGEVTFYCNRDEIEKIVDNRLQDPVINEYKLEGHKILSTTTKQLNKDMKVIFNNPATILFINGKKYVSKAHDEDFDEEKGLLMCLAKAQGISHLELKRMIKGAERPSKPLPPKERKSINGVSIRIEKLELAKKRGRPKKTKEGD